MSRYETKIVDPSTDERWNRFVERHQEGNLYHLSDWIRVIQDTYGFPSHCLATQDDKGRWMGILPLLEVDSRWTGRRLMSLPFSPFAGPLAENQEALEHLLYTCGEKSRALKTAYVQIRCAGANGSIEKADYRPHRYYKMHVLDLSPNEEQILAGFHQSCIRRPVKKALKSGLSLRIARDEEDLRSFFRLQVRTRRKHGLPPQPYAYFQKMWDHFHANGRMRLMMAVHESRVVASILLLRYKDTAVYQNGASDERFLSLKPNHFLLWKGIEMSKKEGYRIFNFGTSSPEDTGLMQFKQRWGAVEQEVPYYYYPDVVGVTTGLESSWKYRVASSVMQRLPVSVLKKIGEWSYRHVA